MAINAVEHVEVADRMSHNGDKGRVKLKRSGRNHAGAKELAGYYSKGQCKTFLTKSNANAIGIAMVAPHRNKK